MRTMTAVTLVGIVLVSCATAGPTHPGPDAAALAAAIDTFPGATTTSVRNVTCDFIRTEGSEWRCRFEGQDQSGRWANLETFVARDGDRWVLIDGVGPAT